MAEYIEREAVIKEQQRFLGYLDNDMLNRLEIAVKRLPIANVEERKTGKWKLIGADKRGRGGIYLCSACDDCNPYKTRFCPNCGARMVADG